MVVLQILVVWIWSTTILAGNNELGIFLLNLETESNHSYNQCADDSPCEVPSLSRTVLLCVASPCNQTVTTAVEHWLSNTREYTTEPLEFENENGGFVPVKTSARSLSRSLFDLPRTSGNCTLYPSLKFHLTSMERGVDMRKTEANSTTEQPAKHDSLGVSFTLSHKIHSFDRYCNNTSKRTNKCEKEVGQLQLECSSGDTTKSSSLIFGPRFIERGDTHITIKLGKTAMLTCPEAYRIPASMMVLYNWTIEDGQKLKQIPGANESIQVDKSSLSEETLESVYYCTVYRASNKDKHDRHTFRVTAEEEDSSGFYLLLPVLCIIFISFPIALVLFLRIREGGFEKQRMVDEVRSEESSFDGTPRHALEKTLVALKLKPKVPRKVSLLPGEALLPISKHPSELKNCAAMRKVRNKLITDAGMEYRFTRPHRCIMRQDVEDYIEDPDADWVVEAITKCDKWIKQLPDPDKISLVSTGSIEVSLQSPEAIVNSEYHGRFNKNRLLISTGVSTTRPDDWILLHRSFTYTKGIMKKLYKHSPSPSPVSSESYYTDTEGTPAPVEPTPPKASYRASKADSLHQYGITREELSAMAARVLKIYVDVGGVKTTLSQRHNILHMFAEFSKEPLYRDVLYHEVDNMMDHLFIITPDMKRYTTLTRKLFKEIQRLAGHDEDKKAPPSTKPLKKKDQMRRASKGPTVGVVAQAKGKKNKKKLQAKK